MATVFDRIIARELPARIAYESDRVIVFADHRPKDKVHLLIVPKEVYTDFHVTPPDVMTMMCDTAKLLAERLGIANHYRIQMNIGYCQEVAHVHMHFLSNQGGEALKQMYQVQANGPESTSR